MTSFAAILASRETTVLAVALIPNRHGKPRPVTLETPQLALLASELRRASTSRYR